MRQQFRSNPYQFIWIQFYFLRYYSTAKIFQGEQSLPNESFSLVSVEKSLSYSDSSPPPYVLIFSFE